MNQDDILTNLVRKIVKEELEKLSPFAPIVRGISGNQAAEYAGVRRQKVADAIRSGRLNAIQTEKWHRINTDDLNEWIKAGCPVV